MKKFHTLLLVLGVVFLACLVWNIGARELWQKIAALGWGLFPLIFGEGLAEMIHTVGWRLCLSEPYRSLPFILLFRIRMAGYAINYLTPTAALGGEVTKAALLAANHPGPEAASGVLIDKVCFALGHLLFVLAGGIVILWRIKLPWVLWVGMAASSAFVGSGMMAFLLLQKCGKLGVVIRWLAKRQPPDHLLQRVASYITEVDEALRVFYREQPHQLGLAIGWHLLGYSVGIFQTWLFFTLLHQTASFAMAACAWFLGMWFDLATFIVPLNLGTLEGSRIVTLKAFGYDALLGMTYGVTLRFGQLFWSAFGLLNYGMLALQPSGLTPDIPAAPPRAKSHPAG